jgi:hypothetical protein
MAEKIVPQARSSEEAASGYLESLESSADDRGNRDALLLSALKGAIQLIDDGEAYLAADILRLGRDRLQAAMEVAHG